MDFVGSTISFTQAYFWITSLLAILALNLVTVASLRACLFAAINIGFVTYLCGLQVTAIVLVLVFLVIQLSKMRALFILLISGILLFVLHKRPGLSATLQIEQLNPFLALFGFSYLILRIVELYRAVAEARYPVPSFIETINYLVPFHMLAMGPIQSYDEYKSQAEVPAPANFEQVLNGCERIAQGLFKKFVLAYVINEVFLTGFQSEGWYLFFEMQLFALWLYIDFSAYTDIVVGVGKLMGVHTPENFNNPYFARNIMEFWERWHITLSLFIRRNLFIPIQMALIRKTRGKHVLWVASVSFLLSFTFCGLWHGLTWAFLLWGICHAFGLILCNLYKASLKRLCTVKQYEHYQQSLLIHAIAVLVTFEFFAFTMYLAFKPWGEIL